MTNSSILFYLANSEKIERHKAMYDKAVLKAREQFKQVMKNG